MLSFPSATNNPPQGYWPRFGEPGRQNSTKWLFKSPPTLPVRNVTHVPGHILYLRFLLWHLWMTRPLCARAWTPMLMFAPNWPMHWAERFSTKLNPKARYIKRNPSAIILHYSTSISCDCIAHRHGNKCWSCYMIWLSFWSTNQVLLLLSYM